MDKWLGFPAVKEYKGLNMEELSLNRAYVIANTTVDNVGIYSVKDACFNCPYKLEKYLKGNIESAWEVDTSTQYLWRIMKYGGHDNVARKNRRGIMCQMKPALREHGVYRLDIGNCVVSPEVPPAHSYLPFLLCCLTLFGIAIVYGLIKLWRSRSNQTKQEKVLQINVDGNENRTRSLHFLRELLMSLIIFTTTGGGGYPIFNNEWGGLSMAECLFFAFSWTIGVNIPAVVDEAFNRHSKCTIIGDIFKRSMVLIFLGLAIDSTVNDKSRLDHVTLWCPLQRLGLAYFIVASTYVLTMHKFELKSKRVICKAIGNLVSLMWCWILSGFILAIAIILISTFASFNCLSNAGLHPIPDYSNLLPDATENCNNETSEYANKLFVAESKKIVDVNSYIGFSRGVMGAISTILFLMIGLKAGIVHLHYKSHSDRLKLWAFWATLFGLGGVIFAGVSYPLKFNLWPISTFIFISTSALYLLSFFYIVLDVCKLGSILIPGVASSASLAVLCGHQLFSNSIPFSWNIMIKSHVMYLVQNVWIVFLWLIIGSILKKRVRIPI